MLRQVLFAKIHRAVVTDANPDYMGSVTIDPILLAATGLAVNEKVLVADCETGDRFETYIFQGEHGSGDVVVNGAAAHRTTIGHHVLIMSFASMTSGDLPPGIKKTRLPAKLENKLPKRPKNEEYALVDDDILLIDKKTNIILDILEDAGRR